MQCIFPCSIVMGIHYAPFASDLTNLQELRISFELSAPFNAFEQLLSVLPPYSSKALPKCLQQLMEDPFSEISDFYPKVVKLDINNQPFDWMGVNLIPFIDAERIKQTVSSILSKSPLSPQEARLMKCGRPLLISAVKSSVKYVNGRFEIDVENDTFKKKVAHENFAGLFLEDIECDKTHCLLFYEIDKEIKHESKLLKGVSLKKEKGLVDVDMVPKIKFKGKQAIEICRKILGYDTKEIDGRLKQEEWDRTLNNNRAIEYNPIEIQLLRRKRYQENQELREKFLEERRKKIGRNNENDEPVLLDPEEIGDLLREENITKRSMDKTNYKNNTSNKGKKEEYNKKLRDNYKIKS